MKIKTDMTVPGSYVARVKDVEVYRASTEKDAADYLHAFLLCRGNETKHSKTGVFFEPDTPSTIEIPPDPKAKHPHLGPSYAHDRWRSGAKARHPKG